MNSRGEGLRQTLMQRPGALQRALRPGSAPDADDFPGPKENQKAW
jgi:hypothetical protein